MEASDNVLGEIMAYLDDILEHSLTDFRIEKHKTILVRDSVRLDLDALATNPASPHERYLAFRELASGDPLGKYVLPALMCIINEQPDLPTATIRNEACGFVADMTDSSHPLHARAVRIMEDIAIGSEARRGRFVYQALLTQLTH